MPLNARSRRRLMIVGGVVVMIGAGLGGAYVLAERAQDRKARAALERGLAAFEQQDYEMSLDGVGRFLQRFGDESTSELLYKYAISRLHTEVPNGRHVIEAVNLLQRIADRDITHVAARTDLMDVRLTLGQNLEALSMAEAVLRAEPEDPAAWRTKARAQLELRDFDAALVSVERLNELAPNDVAGHRLSVQILQQRGDEPDSIVAYAQERVDATGGSLATRIMLSNALILDGKVADAAEVLRSLDQVELADEVSAMQVVTQLERMGGAVTDPTLIRAAMTAAREAEDRFDSDRLRRWLAIRLLTQRDHDGVLDVTAEVAEPSGWTPQNERLVSARALALQGAGDASVEAYRTAMAEAGRSTLRDWAALLALVEDTSDVTGQELIDAADDVLERDRDHPVALLWRAQGQIKQERVDDAVATLRRVSQLTPAWGAPRVAAIRLLLEANREQEALTEAIRAQRLFGGNEELSVLWLRSAMRVTDGRPAAANEELLANVRRVREALPKRGEIALMEIELLHRLGESASADGLAKALLTGGLPDPLVVQLSAMNDRLGLGLGDAIAAEAQRRGGASMVLLSAETLVREGDAAGAVKAIEAGLAMASEVERPTFELALVQAQERAGAADVVSAWGAVTSKHAGTIAVQRAALGSPAVWADEDVSRAVIDRIGTLLGEASMPWRMARAQCLLRHGDGPQSASAAAALLSEVERTSPETVAVYRLRAEALLRLGHDTMAESDLRQAVTLEPGDASSWIKLAELSKRRGDAATAMQQAETAAELELSDTQRIGLASVLNALSQPQRAVDLLSGVSEWTDRKRVALLTAQTLVSAGDLDAAMLAVRPWADERDSGVWSVEAQVHGRRGDTAALGALRETIDTPDATAEELLVLGYVATLLDDADGAETAYRRALAQEPTNTRASSELLRTLLAAGRTEEAASEARSIAETTDNAAHPAHAVAELLELHAETGDQLMRSLAGAAAARAGSGPALAELGSAVAASDVPLSSPDAALLREVVRVAQAYPADPLVQNLYARTLLGAGRSQDALDVANGVLAIDPQNAAAYGLQTEALLEMGRFRDVLDAITAWRETQAYDAVAMDALAARAALGLGDPEQAVETLTRHEDELLAGASETDTGLRLYVAALAATGRLVRVEELLMPRIEVSALARELWADVASDHIRTLADGQRWVAALDRTTPAGDPAGQIDLIRLNRVLGVRLNDSAMLERSRELASRLAERNDLPTNVWFSLGLEGEMAADLDAAEFAYRRGYSERQRTHAIANNLAMILARRGEGAEALRVAANAAR
ncbi:MAG: tetratricopeptide repeat protein, partial [Planctomycetota bacterium]